MYKRQAYRNVLYYEIQGNNGMKSQEHIILKDIQDGKIQRLVYARRYDGDTQTLQGVTMQLSLIHIFVMDKQGYALYFSRSLLPYPRHEGTPVYKHIGIYAYKRDFLLAYAKMAETPLELSLIHI